MGNALKKSPCHWKKTKLAYIVILKRIFHGSKAYRQTDRRSAIHKKLQKRHHRINIPEEEAIRLETHVKSHIKALVDYLESNNNKLGDTGKYVYKKVSKSLDPEVHMIGLIVLRELFGELRRFSYDRDLLCKLMGAGGIDNAALTKEEKKKLYRQQEQEENAAGTSNEPGADITLFKSDIMGNIIEFEGFVIETLYFVLDQKRNPYYEASYIYSLQVLNAYVKNHVGYLPVERMEHIGTRVLDVISEYREVGTRENLEKCFQILEILIMLANSPSLVFSFKMKFIQYACKILRDLYHDDERVSRMNLAESTEDLKKLKQDTKWKAFELIEVVTQSLSDLNEFDIIIVPIFSFFDETQWTDEQLGKDVFVSLLRSMKNYSSFDQIELFVIEKIVDYIHYNPSDGVKSLNAFKHNRENEVKIRVFSVLEAVLREVRKSFLSFIVVDKLINCFVNNLEEKAAVRLVDKRLKETIYSCQRNFLEKIDNSSKSLAQVINSLASQIEKKCQDNEANEIQMTELLLFLQFTIEDIHHFPSQIFVPRTAMLSMLKMRAYSNILFKTFPVTEKLLEISYEIEDSPDGRMGQRDIKRLPCEFDTSYNLLSNNLTTVKMLIEERKDLKAAITSSEDARALGFVMHCTRLNDHLLERRDNTLLGVGLAFIKEIMNLSRDELQVYEKQNHLKAKENSGLLTYLVLRFVKALSEKWGVDFSSFKSTSLAHQIPIHIIDSTEKGRENMTKDDVLNIFASLRSIPDVSSKQYEEESTAFLSFVIIQLQESFPSFKIDTSCMNFDDIDLYKNLNNLNGLVDDDSPEFQSGQGNINIEEIPRLTQNRKESMAIFNQVVRPEKSGQGQTPVKLEVLEEEEENEDSSASSMLDASFKKALKQSRYTKVQETNILKLIEDELL